MAKKKITEIVTKMYPMSELHPDPKNPRTISDEDYAELVDSLLKSPRLLWLNPIVINKKGIIKVGNQRFKAAQELGWTEIPCKSAEDFTPQELKELMIKDNIHQGKWEWSMFDDSWDNDRVRKWGLSELPEKFKPIVDPTINTKPVTQKDIDKAGVEEKEFKQASVTKVMTCPHCAEDFEVRV